MSISVSPFRLGIGTGLLALSVIGIVLSDFRGVSLHDLESSTFEYLERIRDDRKSHTLQYFKEIESAASRVSKDQVIHRFFEEQYASPMQIGTGGGELDRHFVTEYGWFYDLLFIDSTGFVFHSILQEDDYLDNLFVGNLAQTKLSKSLREATSTQFSDFEYYYPSGESAAFFIFPVLDRNIVAGWLVLQCAINQVNTILTDQSQYSRTTEVYLVNSDTLMLSDSRFIEDRTILKVKVDTESVRNAMRSSRGENIITDYRGARVYSSYESFEYFNTVWIIIAEIDESEALTQHYERHAEFFNARIPSYLLDASPSSSNTIRLEKPTKRVDVNEWAKAKPLELLYTPGVSTCTAYSIHYPQNFAYLAHISPTDAVYKNNGVVTRLFLGDRGSNFVRGLTGRMRHYDISLSELPQLQFTIVANHLNSFEKIVQQLIEQGADIDQVRFAYNPGADFADVYTDVSDNHDTIIWKTKSGKSIVFRSDYPSLGDVVRLILREL